MDHSAYLYFADIYYVLKYAFIDVGSQKKISCSFYNKVLKIYFKNLFYISVPTNDEHGNPTAITRIWLCQSLYFN